MQKIARIFEAAMAVLYLVLASLFLFPGLYSKLMEQNLHSFFSKGLCIGFGSVLTVYGIFRIYRVIKKL